MATHTIQPNDVPVSIQGDLVNVYQEPKIGSSIVSQIESDPQEVITDSCQELGGSVNSNGTTNSWWSNITISGGSDDGVSGWVSNTAIQGSNPQVAGVPICKS
jgi:hypothetical protein